ncbi:MAG: 50S ribosomal protein L18 [Deltaproteobacteria bacterium]|nr:50S ribosomal protein L18 [Deltaproteobacteria bacterium]
MTNASTRNTRRIIRQVRVRKKISGTPERPRLAVFRSARHIYAQVIDDSKGITLAHASTLDKKLLSGKDYTGNVASAEKIGKALAEKLLKTGVKKVVFDRGGNIYHGRIKALADGARAGGLEF